MSEQVAQPTQAVPPALPARDPAVKALTDALAEPFEPRDVKFKPQMVKNNRCLAMAYIDARLIQDRLDETVGPEGWEDHYRILPDGSVMCRLRVKIGDRWVTKTDVGSPSEQPDGGDRLKAAFSDSLKRTAVKFGIGRYLYRLPAQWVDYDPVKKQIVQVPQMPAFGMPKKSRSAARTPAAQPEPARQPPPAKDGPVKEAVKGLPKDGPELHARLREYDGKLAAQKLCQVGALLSHVTQAGVKAGYSANLAEWSGPAIPFAVETVKAFEAESREKTGKAASAA